MHGPFCQENHLTQDTSRSLPRNNNERNGQNLAEMRRLQRHPSIPTKERQRRPLVRLQIKRLQRKHGGRRIAPLTLFRKSQHSF